MRRLMRVCAISLALSAALGGTTGARADAVVVGTDEAGDWGRDFDADLGPYLAPIGDATGQDLVSAAIDTSEEGLVKFIIGVSHLPENGGVPEGVRYLWEMTINGEHRELDGKFLNYSRGACDPTSGTCPPPRDPGVAPFILRGKCVSNGAFNACQELALAHATFDTATDTITVPIPLDQLGTGCLTIAAGENGASFPGANLIVIPSAFFSQASEPHDEMLLNEDGVVQAGDC